MDYSEQRTREALAEAEQGGVGVVLSEPRDLQADVRLFKKNRLVRFKPQLVIEDHGGRGPLQEIGSYQIIRAPRPAEAELLRGRGCRNKSPINTKPDGDGFDELARELDRYAAHADLNDLEKIALVFMRARRLARLIIKSLNCGCFLGPRLKAPGQDRGENARGSQEVARTERYAGILMSPTGPGICRRDRPYYGGDDD